jgi:hypothetical protein
MISRDMNTPKSEMYLYVSLVSQPIYKIKIADMTVKIWKIQSLTCCLSAVERFVCNDTAFGMIMQGVGICAVSARHYSIFMPPWYMI